MLRNIIQRFIQPRFDHIGTDNHLRALACVKISVSALPSNSGLLKYWPVIIISPEKTAQNQHRHIQFPQTAITVCDKRPLAILLTSPTLIEVSMLTSCFTL